MTGYFTAEMIKKLQGDREIARQQLDDLLTRYLSRTFNNANAQDYARYGFCRRLRLLVHAIDFVYKILPPEREDIPEGHEVADATMAMQSFVINTFGCLDNLAWILVYEKDVRGQNGEKLSREKVGFGKHCKELRESLSNEFRDYLDLRKPWLEHVKTSRDSLAHRIPHYIPPYIVLPESWDEYSRLEEASGKAMRQRDAAAYDRLKSEQRKLGCFHLSMTHGPRDASSGVVVHAQLLADFFTIDEFGKKVLEELDRPARATPPAPLGAG